MPQYQPGPQLDEAIALVHEGARAAGRDPASLGMEGRITVRRDSVDQMPDGAEQWRRAGATHVSFNTMGAGLRNVDEHLEVLGHVATALRSSGPTDLS